MDGEQSKLIHFVVEAHNNVQVLLCSGQHFLKSCPIVLKLFSVSIKKKMEEIWILNCLLLFKAKCIIKKLRHVFAKNDKNKKNPKFHVKGSNFCSNLAIVTIQLNHHYPERTTYARFFFDEYPDSPNVLALKRNKNQ